MSITEPSSPQQGRPVLYLNAPSLCGMREQMYRYARVVAWPAALRQRTVVYLPRRLDLFRVHLCPVVDYS